MAVTRKGVYPRLTGASKRMTDGHDVMSRVLIPFRSLRPHIEGAACQGLTTEALLSQSFVDLHHGDERDVVSPAQALLLCLNTALASDDATHGLARMGVRAKYVSIGVMMALGCSTLEAAIQVLRRLYASESPSVRIHLDTVSDSATLSVHMEPRDRDHLAYLEENFLIWMFIQCLRFLGRAPPLLDVTVRDPHHFNLGRLHWGLKGVVRYGDVTAFRFPRKLLGASSASQAGEDVMWECHRLWLDYVEAPESRATPSAYLNDNGFVRFADMVSESGQSPNTLRRRLKASDLGFRDGRRRSLVHAASLRLAQSDDSVEAVAADLGYKDAKGFRRFIRNATGLTPGQLRERSRLPDTGDEVRGRIQALGETMNV